jgi:hypothetical protein
MKGIIFNTKQDFDNWNNSVTEQMIEEGEQMEIWCNPIISKEGKYFASTQTQNKIRQQIISNNLIGLQEVEISQSDEDWFEQNNENSL